MMERISHITGSMQQTEHNSSDAYVRIKAIDRSRIRKDVPGNEALGPPDGTGGGVKAVEAVPTRDVFALCDAEVCLDSSVDRKHIKGVNRPQKDDTDEIVGDVERCPGESRMAAAAFTSETDAVAQQKKGLVYSATDFRPYSRR